jgi:flagellar biosynthesis chaperone FliJ
VIVVIKPASFQEQLEGATAKVDTLEVQLQEATSHVEAVEKQLEGVSAEASEDAVSVPSVVLSG